MAEIIPNKLSISRSKIESIQLFLKILNFMVKIFAASLRSSAGSLWIDHDVGVGLDPLQEGRSPITKQE